MMIQYIPYPFPQPDANDKLGCVAKGDYFEDLFPLVYGPGTVTNIQIAKNPEKIKGNQFAIDIIHFTAIIPFGDIKYRDIPFYTGWERFHIDPQYLMTFNVFDAGHYAPHGNVVIYFWVQWFPSTYSNKRGTITRSIRGMTAVYECLLDELVKEGERNLVHEYEDDARFQRDGGNKPNSYVLDLRRFRNASMKLDERCWPTNPDDFTNLLLDEIVIGKIKDGLALPTPSNEPLRSICQESIANLNKMGLVRMDDVRWADGKIDKQATANITVESWNAARDRQFIGCQSRVEMVINGTMWNGWRNS